MAKNSYILNFNNSRNLSDIKYEFDNFGKTNIDFLLDSFQSGSTSWSVPKKAAPGDFAVFMCAKTARNNLGVATSHIPDFYNQDFKDFVERQKALYKKHSGYLLGYGIVSSFPEYDDESNRWYAEISELHRFENPIFIDDFRSFIFISQTNSITYLKEEQWERLKWLIHQKNPNLFPNAVLPFAETIEHEFKEAVYEKEKKPLNQLKKEAEKKASQPIESTVKTKVYHRDPAIAAYVKKRANGYCQLCGQKAPFNDQNGEPYLECHHIEWLSNGGMDSPDNCVAICPNCHRKLHILNSDDDINLLKLKVSQ